MLRDQAFLLLCSRDRRQLDPAANQELYQTRASKILEAECLAARSPDQPERTPFGDTLRGFRNETTKLRVCQPIAHSTKPKLSPACRPFKHRRPGWQD